MRFVYIPLIVMCLTPAIFSDQPAALNPAKQLEMPLFANTPLVDRLAALLNEKDPVVRETAAQNLGETHNPPALGALRNAVLDEHALVPPMGFPRPAGADDRGIDLAGQTR